MMCALVEEDFLQHPQRLASPREVTEVLVNPDIMVPMIPKVEWLALPEAADTTSRLQLYLVEVPKELLEGYQNKETFLKKMHHVLLEVDMLEGTLQ
ncbi:Multifunctional methyltransferase subunit TRM112-like protein [Sciurus carolinensis]|uniref:Multifunctional methyltransferase subunit TRM112-like protein n=1 Tax=Sciurus carolinensis TaxID=30640 RepID=A0AA41MMD4_SCICA|nr:Multifunctional methyltransferase subunit TRM112-like protein [Sciurus carolinensis]